MDLKEKVKSLPLSPGVYLMKDTLGNTIYVGKAKNLKQRVRSYFQNSKNHSQKIQKLVKNINDFEVIQTDTEFEAFLLECQLIQDIKPFFNSRMKSPQTYPYIVIKRKQGRREIEITQQPQPDTDSLIFGPYTSKNAVEKAIHALKEYYRIDCSNPSNSKTPCLNFSLGSCIGICLGGPVLEQYEDSIDHVIRLLSGKDGSILGEMKRKMNLASEHFEFETAAKLRESIEAIHFLLDRKKVITFATKPKNMVVIESLDDNAIKLFLIKGNKVLYKKRYILDRLEINQLQSLITREIFSYFKKNQLKRDPLIEQSEMDQARIIYSYLKNSNSCYLMIPQTWLNSGNDAKLAKAVKNWLTEGQFL